MGTNRCCWRDYCSEMESITETARVGSDLSRSLNPMGFQYMQNSFWIKALGRNSRVRTAGVQVLKRNSRLLNVCSPRHLRRIDFI